MTRRHLVALVGAVIIVLAGLVAPPSALGQDSGWFTVAVRGSDGALTSSGISTTETRIVGPFQGLHIRHAFDVEVIEGLGYSAIVEADDNVVPVIRTQVIRDELVVEFMRSVRLREDNLPRVAITIPSLKAMHVAGISRVQVSRLNQDHFFLNASGATRAIVDGGVIRRAEVYLSGNIPSAPS